MDGTMDGTAQLLESDRRFLVHPLHHPEDHRTPLLVTEGRGAMLHLADGREVIDGLAGLWNVNVGHGRGELADAAAGQMRKIAYASAYVGATNEPAIRLAEKIVKHAYAEQLGGLLHDRRRRIERVRLQDRALFLEGAGQAGKDQVHLAHARLSRRHDGGDERDRHGRRITRCSGRWCRVSSRSRRPIRIAGRATRSAASAPPRRSSRRSCAEGPETVAGVICEPVMGAGGVIVPPDSYFPKLREICDKYDVLLIADEVITGFGRTGRWFALGHWGVEPDIVSFAKGVTSGYLPLGGNILSKRVHDAILNAPLDRRYMHAATYSGHPVCCAVGLRNVEIIDSEGLVDRAAVMGKRLLDNLKQELGDLPVVGDIRGLGMMCGVELVADRGTKAPALGLGVKVAREAMSRGLLARARPGSADPAIGDTICLSPPLSTPEEILDRIPRILREFDRRRDEIIASFPTSQPRRKPGSTSPPHDVLRLYTGEPAASDVIHRNDR